MALLTKNIATMKAEARAHVAVGGKGCFIGCLTHSGDPRMIEERFGFPVMLTRVVEDIFKGLPVEEQPRFFGDIPAAIDRDGKDLNLVVWAFLEEELRGLPNVLKGIQEVIDPVISGMERLASGGKWSEQDAIAAADAADAAADAAEANPQNARQRQAATILRLIAEAPVVQSEGV